jgi:alpha-beta hydrolase superfamily lysophospholipase
VDVERCPGGLPRRAFLGAVLAADREAFTAAGICVDDVVPGGMAAHAGVIRGDVITSVAGLPVRSLAELARALRRAGADAATTLTYTRGEQPSSRTVEVTRAASEQLDGIAVQLGAVEVAGDRLRTIVTIAPAPRAAILVLQGIACESIETPDTPLVALVHGWARAGLDTIRIDKRGLGDSEGAPCGELDFETELAGYRAALELAVTHARSRGVPLVVFGHSVGAIVAARLVPDHAVAGCILYGAPCARWLACLIETTRRQLGLQGASPDAIERAATDLAERAFIDGLNGRSAAYHRQLDAIEPATLWARVAVPLLVVRGEHDWVVRADDQARITTLVRGPATMIDLPHLDHVMGWHPDHAASLRDYGAGPADPSIVAATLAWIDRLL